MLDDIPPRRRWPRSQRFTLSEKGTAAELAYRSTIVESRSTEGRKSFDAAREAWAKGLGIQPDDGLYLGEVRTGPVTLEHIVESIESCGKTKKDAFAAIERLID